MSIDRRNFLLALAATGGILSSTRPMRGIPVPQQDDLPPGASPGDWPVTGCTLKQTRSNIHETTIGPNNVDRLKVKWTFDGFGNFNQGTPIVVGNTLYFTVLAAQWFIRRRGRAMSVMFVGFPLGIAISVPISQLLIDSFGWRTAWAVLGLTGGFVVLAITRLILRNRPEDMGLQPDGGPVDDAGTIGRLGFIEERSWTLREAIRTGAFWRLSVAFGTVMLGMSAIGLFWIPYFLDLGFQPYLAAWALSAYALSQAGSSLLLAPFIDRFQPRFLAMFGFVSFIAALLLMMNVNVAWQMFLAALLGGAGVGSGMLLNAQLWPAYFGRRNIGAIRGAALPLTLAFSGAGSAATGMIFDATGSYAPAWWRP